MFEFSFCRLCLRSSGRLLDIFIKNSPYKALVVETLEDLMRLKVVEEDRSMPWLICRSCLSRLSEFRDFKTCCLRNKLVFDSMCRISTDKISHPSSKYPRKEELEWTGEDEFASQSKVEVPASPIGSVTGVEVSGWSVGINDDNKGMRPEASDVDCGISSDVDSVPENCCCTMCLQEFVTFKEMKTHAKVCQSGPWHGKPSPGVQSQMIDKGTSREALSVHGSGPFDPTLSCSRCGKTFRTERRLVQHIEKHDFKCGMRGKRGHGNREGFVEGSSNAKPSVGTTDCVVQARQRVCLKEVCGVQKNGNFKSEQGLRLHVCHGGTVETNPEAIPAEIDVEGNQIRATVKEEPGNKFSEAANEAWDGRLPLIDCQHDMNRKRALSRGRIDGIGKSLGEKRVVCSNVGSVKAKVDGCTRSGDSDGIDSLPRGGRVLGGGVNDLEDNKKSIQCPVASLTKVDRLDSRQEVLAFVAADSFGGDSDGIDSLPWGGRVLGGGINDLEDNKKSIQCPVASLTKVDRLDSRQEVLTFVCDYCQKPYEQKEDLRNHIVKFHLCIDLQKCPVCHRLFTNRDELEEHSETHPKGKKFFCTVCKECFQYQISLRKHIIGNHNVIKAYICTLCCNGFLYRADLGVHHTMVHTESDKRFKCDECGKRYINIKSYRNHLKLCQLKSVCFKCNVCGKELSSKGNLAFHMMIHSKLKKYACSMCDKVFTHCRSRNLHERCVHLKVKPHECGICNKRFANKYMVKLHYVSHSDHRPFLCTACPKSFKSKYALRKHVLCVH